MFTAQWFRFPLNGFAFHSIVLFSTLWFVYGLMFLFIAYCFCLGLIVFCLRSWSMQYEAFTFFRKHYILTISVKHAYTYCP